MYNYCISSVLLFIETLCWWILEQASLLYNKFTTNSNESAGYSLCWQVSRSSCITLHWDIQSHLWWWKVCFGRYTVIFHIWAFGVVQDVYQEKRNHLQNMMKSVTTGSHLSITSKGGNCQKCSVSAGCNKGFSINTQCNSWRYLVWIFILWIVSQRKTKFLLFCYAILKPFHTSRKTGI